MEMETALPGSADSDKHLAQRREFCCLVVALSLARGLAADDRPASGCSLRRDRLPPKPRERERSRSMAVTVAAASSPRGCRGLSTGWPCSQQTG